jgi:hypothetical protein
MERIDTEIALRLDQSETGSMRAQQTMMRGTEVGESNAKHILGYFIGRVSIPSFASL